MDILVGWHIDHHQSAEVMKYVSLALQSFSHLWQINVSIATTLLTQFVEDLEDYCEVRFVLLYLNQSSYALYNLVSIVIKFVI